MNLKLLNTVFLGIITAVALGAAAVWYSGQPTRAERQNAQFNAELAEWNAALDLDEFRRNFPNPGALENGLLPPPADR